MSARKAERALQNFFREQTLVALRELALRQAAHEVEHRMVDGETPVFPRLTASLLAHASTTRFSCW